MLVLIYWWLLLPENISLLVYRYELVRIVIHTCTTNTCTSVYMYTLSLRVAILYVQLINLSTAKHDLCVICKKAWIRVRRRVNRRLTRIQAVWHSANISTHFEPHWSTFKIEADKKFSRRQFIWRAKVKVSWKCYLSSL